MISKQQIELNVCREYIRRVEQRFPEPTYESQKFLLILQIYEWQLKRYLRRIPLELHQLGTLKHGIRSAERLLQEISGGEPRWVAEEIAQILCAVILEFTQEVAQNEELYPELKESFDTERAEYRKLLAGMLEAEALD